MKTLLVILLLSTGGAFAQTITYTEVSNATVKPKGDFEQYVTLNGDTISVGDTISLGVPAGANGNFVYIKKYTVMGDPLPVGTEAANSNAIIKRIYAFGTKRAGFKIWLQTKGFTFLDNYYFSLEDAIGAGEIVSKTMTSDQALAELKKAKDKLDLELITQEEYDRIKAELSRYIK